MSKGTKFQDYCIDYLYSIGKLGKRTLGRTLTDTPVRREIPVGFLIIILLIAGLSVTRRDIASSKRTW